MGFFEGCAADWFSALKGSQKAGSALSAVAAAGFSTRVFETESSMYYHYLEIP
jgi:hypothetical protein